MSKVITGDASRGTRGVAGYRANMIAILVLAAFGPGALSIDARRGAAGMVKA